MNKTIKRVRLCQLLPENLRCDPDIILASRAVDRKFRALLCSIKNCLTIGDVDHASSEVVDNLAGEINVDFYDQSLPLETRRQLVKNGYQYKYLKGTAGVVKQIVSDIFTDIGISANTEVKEWFQYGGEPFTFKISTEANLPNENQIANLLKAINSVKNARSTLETIEAIKKAQLEEYYGFGVQQTYYHYVTVAE